MFVVRKQVQKWLVKLVSMSENDKNKKNRNQHIGFMLQQLQTLELTAPFLKDPPSGTPRELGRTVIILQLISYFTMIHFSNF